MKLLFLLICLVPILGFAEFSIETKTILNPPPPQEVFVPPGFDDLDDVEITFVNYSTSSCLLKTFTLAPEVDHDRKVIRITNISMLMQSDFCRFRQTSSPRTLKLGELPAGTYKVEFETEKGKFTPYTEITVNKSKNEQKDDYEYAPIDVNELTVKVDRESKNIILNLPGMFPNGCYAFKEVKVIDDRSDKVIEVLPIVDMMTTVCTMALKPFSEEIKIPYSVNELTKKLIHIRSADGVAINRVVTLE